MKKQILEVQNYFINKITACEFDSYEIKYSNDGWFNVSAEIDGYLFYFSIHSEFKIISHHRSFMDLEIPNTRLSNLLKFIEAHKEKMKAEKIEKLKAELAELEPKQKFNINPQK